MGLLDIASQNSIWRGYDYYKTKKVVSWEKTGEKTYSATVSGSGNNRYQVEINLEHPRKSHCSCPFADGRRVICKHMIALYFTMDQDAVKEYEEMIRQWELEEEEEEELEMERYEEICEYVYSLSKEELQSELIVALMEREEYDHYW